MWPLNSIRYDELFWVVICPLIDRPFYIFGEMPKTAIWRHRNCSQNSVRLYSRDTHSFEVLAQHSTPIQTQIGKLLTLRLPMTHMNLWHRSFWNLTCSFYYPTLNGMLFQLLTGSRINPYRRKRYFIWWAPDRIPDPLGQTKGGGQKKNRRIWSGQRKGLNIFPPRSRGCYKQI